MSFNTFEKRKKFSYKSTVSPVSSFSDADIATFHFTLQIFTIINLNFLFISIFLLTV